MKTLFWFFRNLPQKGRFIFWGLLLSAEMGSVLITPALLQSLYEKNNSAVYLPVLILCSIFILLGSLGQSQIYQQGICKLRNDLWKQHLHTSLLHMRTEGEVFTLLIDDAERSMIFLQGFTAASLFRGFVFVGAAVIILAMKSVNILWIALAINMFSMGLIGLLARKRKRVAEEQRTCMAKAAEFTSEMLRAREEIWAYGQEDAFLKRYGEVSAQVTRVRKRAAFWDGISNTVSGFLDVAAQPLAIMAGFWLGSEEGLLMIAGYAAVLVKGGLAFMMFWTNAQGAIPSGRRIKEVLEND